VSQNPTSIEDRSAIAFGLGAVALWSTVATAFEIALDHVTPLQLLWLASLFSWILLSLVAGFQGTIASRPKRDWIRALVAGLLNPVGYYLMLFAAYDRLPGQEAMALNYTWALAMALLAVPMLGHALRRVDLVAALIAYAGVWTIATRGQILQVQFANAQGVGFAIGSTLLWAFYWLLSARDPRPPLLSQWQNFTVAVPVLTVIVVKTHSWQDIGSIGVWSSLYVGLCEMGIAFLLWQEAVRRTTTTARLANLIFLSPPVSLLLLYWVRGEELTPSTLVGLALILGGLTLQNLCKRESQAAKSSKPVEPSHSC